MKEILLTSAYIVGFGELILACYFLVTNANNSLRKVTGAMVGISGLWVLTSALVAYKPESAFTIFGGRLIYVFGIFLLTTLLHFAVLYPYKKFAFDWLHSILFYLPAVIFSSIALFTPAILEGVTLQYTPVGSTVIGSVYNIYLLLLYIVCVCALIYKYSVSEGHYKKSIALITIAILLGGIPAVVIDLIAPIINHNVALNSLYANIFSVVWLGTIGYLVMKK